MVKQKTYSAPIGNIQNNIIINKSKSEIVKINCRDWYLINNSTNMHKEITAWKYIYSNFKFKDKIFWKIIRKMSFICS